MKNVKIEITNYEESKSIMAAIVYILEEEVTFKLTFSKLKTRITLHVKTKRHPLDIINILNDLNITKHKVSFKIDNIWHYTHIGIL